MFPQLARFTDLGVLLLRLMVGLVFITSGYRHLKDPEDRSKSIGMSKGFTIFLGTVEVAAARARRRARRALLNAVAVAVVNIRHAGGGNQPILGVFPPFRKKARKDGAPVYSFLKGRATRQVSRKYYACRHIAYCDAWIRVCHPRGKRSSMCPSRTNIVSLFRSAAPCCRRQTKSEAIE